MSIITIHCRLVASELVRRALWYLMTEKNTPLVNTLLKQVSQQSKFETWQRQGTMPPKVVKELCEPLKEIYPNQPPRFYASATQMVTQIYESWLALHQSHRLRLDGKQRWLNVVMSDADLRTLSGATLETIQQQAQTILSKLSTEPETQSKSNKNKRKQAQRHAKASNNSSLFNRLFEEYEATDDTPTKCVIAYLIKNDGKIPEAEEDPEKFAQRIHRKRKEIEQLEAQLRARLPKGRDLTGAEFLETLTIATHQLSENVVQEREWQAKLLTRPASMPYPIMFGSLDVRWRKTAKGNITVNFNGVDKYLKEADPDIQKWFKTNEDHPFQLYCDQRQLPFFQRFLQDWQDYTDKANKDTYPAGLLTLRSAMLAWREGEGKGEPWNVNHLTLYCSFDTRLMTAEGTLTVQQEKVVAAQKKLTKPDSDPRIQSTLNRLQNLPNRPSKKPYQGNPDILIGLSIGLANPVTVAVVNGRTGEVLAYRTPQTLLGNQYRLLRRHRHQQQQNALRRHKNQKRGVAHQPSESELGQYVDRLLAKAIIQLAQQYQAGSIVIPSSTHLRELLASEITARAEQKCPGSVEAQNRYARKYREAIHRWSYNRLIEAIQGKATQLDIAVESGFQPLHANSQEQATDIAIAAYHSRALTKN